MRSLRRATRAVARGDALVLPVIEESLRPRALAQAGLSVSDPRAVPQLAGAAVGRLRLLQMTAARPVPLVVAPDRMLVRMPEEGTCGDVVDGAREPALIEIEAGCPALLLVFPRAVVAEVAAALFGNVGLLAQGGPPPGLGGAGSAWAALMHYCARLLRECPDQLRQGEIGARLEEAFCAELLRNRLEQGRSTAVGKAVPRHVKLAEAYMQAHAARSPTIVEVARAAGVSERVLSAAFRRFRGTSPGAALRALRLQGVRAALERAETGTTVASVAAGWGYANFGVFARAYARHFGELPSATLRRARRPLPEEGA